MANELIVSTATAMPVFTVSPTALAERDEALANAALIGKIENQEQNDTAVRAAMELKRIANLFEQTRKRVKEPLIAAGRKLDAMVAAELAEVEKEMGRLSNLARDFQLAEQRRIREEQEAQQRELERIEREKQAEMQRIAAEAAEAQRRAREIQAEEERKARLAASEQERIAAEARAEQARKDAAAAAAQAQVQFQRVEESAQAKTMAQAKPIFAQRTAGQVVRDDWDVQVVNPYELAKFHPDCCKIEPLLAPIKALLNQGVAVKGVRAEKKVTAGFRAASSKTIDV